MHQLISIRTLFAVIAQRIFTGGEGSDNFYQTLKHKKYEEKNAFVTLTHPSLVSIPVLNDMETYFDQVNNLDFTSAHGRPHIGAKGGTFPLEN